MTEKQWLKCTDIVKLLESLRGKAGDRKLRLFTCACCRRIWHLLTDERSRRAVEVAEEFADGGTSEDRLAESREAAFEATNDLDGYSDASCAAYNSACPPNDAYIVHVQDVASQCQEAMGPKAEATVQTALLRCLFGNLFKSLKTKPAWLTPPVKHLAQAIYEDRNFAQLPILADLLQEAGCDQGDVLKHLRGGGAHVRGCWALDLILGRE